MYSVVTERSPTGRTTRALLMCRVCRRPTPHAYRGSDAAIFSLVAGADDQLGSRREHRRGRELTYGCELCRTARRWGFE